MNQKPSSPRLAILYARASTRKQDISPQAQLAACRSWCASKGFAIAREFSEQVSGKRQDNRPELAKAKALACKTKGVLVVYCLSRLARSIGDADEILKSLMKCGADLASTTEPIDTTNAAGRVIFGFLSLMSQFERELTAERTSAALQFKKTRGERVGTVPFGKRLSEDGEHLEDDPVELAAMQMIAEMRPPHKRMGYGLIAVHLNFQGVRARSDRWDRDSVRRAHRAWVKRSSNWAAIISDTPFNT